MNRICTVQCDSCSTSSLWKHKNVSSVTLLSATQISWIDTRPNMDWGVASTPRSQRWRPLQFNELISGRTRPLPYQVRPWKTFSWLLEFCCLKTPTWYTQKRMGWKAKSITARDQYDDLITFLWQRLVQAADTLNPRDQHKDGWVDKAFKMLSW